MTGSSSKGFFQSAAIICLLLSAVFCATGFSDEHPETGPLCDPFGCSFNCVIGAGPCVLRTCNTVTPNMCDACTGCRGNASGGCMCGI